MSLNKRRQDNSIYIAHSRFHRRPAFLSQEEKVYGLLCLLNDFYLPHLCWWRYHHHHHLFNSVITKCYTPLLIQESANDRKNCSPFRPFLTLMYYHPFKNHNIDSIYHIIQQIRFKMFFLSSRKIHVEQLEVESESLSSTII